MHVGKADDVATQGLLGVLAARHRLRAQSGEVAALLLREAAEALLALGELDRQELAQLVHPFGQVGAHVARGRFEPRLHRRQPAVELGVRHLGRARRGGGLGGAPGEDGREHAGEGGQEGDERGQHGATASTKSRFVPAGDMSRSGLAATLVCPIGHTM